MTRVYIIRHAEAEGNLYRRIHGQYDSLVTDRGMKQIDALARRFEGVHIDAVYSSDLCRARTTAGAIYLPKKLPLHTDPRLREISMGVWEDKTWGEVEADETEQYRAFSLSPDRWHVPGSESWEAVQRRMHEAVMSIAAESDGGTVAIVSHGCAIRAFMSLVLGVPASDRESVPHCDNTSVNLFEVENGRAEAVFINDVSHLPDGLTDFRRETWWKSEDASDERCMRIEPFNVAANRELYLARYREAWEISYGSATGFSSVYYDWAVMRSLAEERSVAQAYVRGRPAGMIELAPDSGADEGCGHIAFLCMDREFRRKGLAVQLIGYAVSFYRPRGRDRLRLRVAQANKQAMEFYRRYGFHEVRREGGALGDAVIMEKGIALT